jgi:hypothetical protein
VFSRFLARVRQQWMGALALFLVLTGGVAYAAGTITSSDIVDNQVFSADVRNDSLTGGGLTGADIRDHAGVDTCSHGTVRLGALCFRTAGDTTMTWLQAVGACDGLHLRLPTVAEAMLLATTYDLPDLTDQEMFWTDAYYSVQSGPRSLGVNDGGGSLDSDWQSMYRGACVTTPTN